MNISNNSYLFSTITIRSIKKSEYKNPFDSWYIGGILFMCTVMFVLLYANYYRENTCQIIWFRLLTKLHLIPSLPTSSMSSTIHHFNDPLTI